MRRAPERSISPDERSRFESTRDATTLQLLFKASRLANEQALALANAHAGAARVRQAHTTLFPYLDFDGIRLTDLAARVGVTKQAVGQLVDDLEKLGMVERVSDPADGRAKLIRFSRRGYTALLRGIGVLRDLEETLRVSVGARRMREFHDTLGLVVAALEAAARTSSSLPRPSR